MGSVLSGIDPTLAGWLESQPVFFVATAPLAADGRVNVSPRGGGVLSVLDERTVAWVDYTGSGAETVAHLRENGRICVMFCAFERRPRIVRLHGTGTVSLPGSAEFAAVAARHPEHAATRAVIAVAVTRVSESCGWGVPQMDLVADRDLFTPWAAKKGPEGLRAYRAAKNAVSIDGLPALAGLGAAPELAPGALATASADPGPAG